MFAQERLEPVVVVLVDEEDSKGGVSLPLKRSEQKSDLVYTIDSCEDEVEGR
jgi:hypothetical protein